MLIYDKKENSIDIYTIEAKKEELKKYRKSVLQRHKNEQLFYGLRTNCKNTIKVFKVSDEINNTDVNYDNGTPYCDGTWSWISTMNDFGRCYNKKEIQETILEKYIEGDYDYLKPTRVFEYDYNEKAEKEVYRLLQMESSGIIGGNSHGDVYAIKNMINLPRNLYLLHLLLNGNFSKLTKENIKNQLEMFEIEYQRSIQISDLEDILSTGLVNGTINGAIEKAEVGSAILRKVKKEN